MLGLNYLELVWGCFGGGKRVKQWVKRLMQTWFVQEYTLVLYIMYLVGSRVGVNSYE